MAKKRAEQATVIPATNMLVSATHTHSAPGQYFPFAAYDITFPNLHTATAFSVQPDPQLYGFLARRLATAIARADDDLGPGAVAWGHAEIPEGLTENRSIEAHLANYGIDRELGEGDASEAPGGPDSTIAPDLDVLRVDKRVGGRLVLRRQARPSVDRLERSGAGLRRGQGRCAAHRRRLVPVARRADPAADGGDPHPQHGRLDRAAGFGRHMASPQAGGGANPDRGRR